jgi:hypothetical protein
MLTGWLKHIMESFVDGYLLQPLFDLGGGLVTTRTVDDWLWSGTDPLLAFLVSVGQTDSAASNLFTNHESLAEAETLEEGKTDTIFTGQGRVDRAGQYIEYEESTTVNGMFGGTPIWTSDEEIHATDATIFDTDLQEGDELEAWVSDILRVAKLKYDSTVDTKGIETFRFVIHDDVLGVSEKYHQTIKGLANMTSSKGIPFFLSLPHFLNGDADKLPGAEIGMDPDAAKHDIFIDVEPLSGLTLSARKRLQVVFGITAGDAYTTDVADIFLPLMWIEEGATVPDDTAEDLKDGFNQAETIKELVTIGGPTLGILLLASSGFILVRSARKP